MAKIHFKIKPSGYFHLVNQTLKTWFMKMSPSSFEMRQYFLADFSTNHIETNIRHNQCESQANIPLTKDTNLTIRKVIGNHIHLTISLDPTGLTGTRACYPIGREKERSLLMTSPLFNIQQRSS